MPLDSRIVCLDINDGVDAKKRSNKNFKNVKKHDKNKKNVCKRNKKTLPLLSVVQLYD